MDFDEDAFMEELDALVTKMPKGSDFEIDLFQGDLRIVNLGMPETGKGAGRDFLAKVLSLADRHGLTTSLQADETGEPGYPTTFQLVRFYSRFGFAVTHCDSTAFIVLMARPTHEVREDEVSILQDYEAARERDLTEEAFDAMKGRILKDGCDTAASPRPDH